MVSHPLIGARMAFAQPLAAVLVDRNPRLADELVGEQAPAHADLAMDAPDGEVEALVVERLLPGEHMLIDAVDQRAVEVEKENRLYAHGIGPRGLAGHRDHSRIV